MKILPGIAIFVIDSLWRLSGKFVIHSACFNGDEDEESDGREGVAIARKTLSE